MTTESKPGTGLRDLLQRQPFAILGAIALLSLARDLLQLHSWLSTWIDAWQAITRPISTFLLGGFFKWLHLALSDKLKDYFSIGLVVFGMNFRAGMYATTHSEHLATHFLGIRLFSFRSDNRLAIIADTILLFLEALFFWPAVILFRISFFLQERKRSAVSEFQFYIFLETFVWTLIAIALSYGLTHRHLMIDWFLNFIRP